MVLAAALAGAAIAAKTRQSMILGYLAAGVVLGYLSTTYLQPNYGLDVVNNDSVSIMADLGVAFLLFFVGLEVSMSRLRTAGRSATVLALADVAVLYFTGTLLGLALGWPLMDTMFLAGILAMSSVGIAAKSLTELKRLANDETATLLGMMIVEDFITMVILAFTIAWAMGASNPGAFSGLIEGVVLVYGALIVVCLFIVPRLVSKIERVRNDEVFALLALALIFASAALAITYGMPFIIGTFFVGMAFAETRLSERLTLRLSTLRDAFVGVFFLTFGVQIHLSAAIANLWVVVAAVLVVLIDEIFILGALSVLIGFKGRAAAMIGASAVGRGEDSIIFANIGAGLTHPAGSALAGTPVLSRAADLYPVAGGVSLVTSAIVPVAMRHVNQLARVGALLIPHGVRFGTATVGEYLREAHLTRRPHGATAKPRWMVWAACAYVALLGAVLATDGMAHFAMAAMGAALCAAIAHAVFTDAMRHLPATRVGRRHGAPAAHRAIARHAAFTVGSLFLLGDIIAASIAFDPFATLVIAAVAVAAIAVFALLSVRQISAARPREEAQRLVTRARHTQRTRLSRKYRRGAPQALLGAPTGLRSIREFTFEAERRAPPARRAGAEAGEMPPPR